MRNVKHFNAILQYFRFRKQGSSSSCSRSSCCLCSCRFTTSSEDFDPVRHILEHVPSEENELAYFEKQAALRLAQLDKIADQLSRQVMEHHEVMVKGMNLVGELEKDLQIANVICMNGRRHLTSSVNEVSRDLIVNSNSKKKQALLDMIPILAELRCALNMQSALESLVEEGNYCKMSHGAEVWLGKMLQKLDALLLGVCKEFMEEGYITEEDVLTQNSRLTYSDLCLQISESSFRQCLLRTLAVLFKLMCSYHNIMGFQLDNKDSVAQALNMKCNDDISYNSHEVRQVNSDAGTCIASSSDSRDKISSSSPCWVPTTTSSLVETTKTTVSQCTDCPYPVDEAKREDSAGSSSESPWYQLQKEATAFVSQTLQRGRKNHSLLVVYRYCFHLLQQKLKVVCENYFVAIHRQNVHALKMVLEKETWFILPPDTVQFISFAGLIGDGTPLIVSSDGSSTISRVNHSDKSTDSVHTSIKKIGFSDWLHSGNPFLQNVFTSKEGHSYSQPNGTICGEVDGNISDNFHGDEVSPRKSNSNKTNGTDSVLEDENEDLLADFIDEDKITAQTGSSISLLRSVDKYARLMQILEIVNVEFFKQHTNLSGKGSADSLNYRLRKALSRITQDCNQWIKPQSTSPAALSASFTYTDVTPTSPLNTNFGHFPGTSLGLKERCVGADTVSLVARILHRSKAHLQSMLLKSNTTAVEDFHTQLVDAVPDLTEHIHRTTVRQLLHVNGYVDRIANAKWELKDLGLEHNGIGALVIFLHSECMSICCWENSSTIKRGLLMEEFAKSLVTQARSMCAHIMVDIYRTRQMLASSLAHIKNPTILSAASRLTIRIWA
ncbi:syndetin isoform X1 [Quillaja saponaria]|uniref:Syndetin isoform X1 n=1 Tax=Quillaja saponaria TaxID=32244 RepID=A0AAD7VMK7_QUISA|nr:syndetin isoform X1 [Quillaja saponaria]